MNSNIKNRYYLELKKTRIIIENIKTLGIDTSSYEGQVEVINMKVNITKSLTAIIKYIEKLKHLQKELKEYEIEFEVKTFNNLLNMDLDIENLNKLSEEIIIYLKKIQKHTKNDEKYNKTINEFLDNVYKIIKLEFIYFRKSRILDYIIKNKFFIYEINKRIQEDISFVKKAINLMPGINRLQSKINEQTKKGIETDYVTEEIVASLIMCTNFSELEELINTKLKDFNERIGDTYMAITETLNKKEECKESIKNQKINTRKNLKIIRNKLAALFLSGTILVTGSYFLEKQIKKVFTSEVFHTITKTYNSDSSLNTTEEAYLEKLEKEYQVIVEFSNKIESDLFWSKKLVSLQYDVTDLFKDKTDSFSFDDFSFLTEDRLINKDTVTGGAYNLEEEEPIYKYIIICQDYLNKDEDLKEAEYYTLLGIVLIVDFLIYLLIFILFECNKLPKDCSNYTLEREKLINLNKKLEQIKTELLKTINSDEALKKEYQEFMENYQMYMIDKDKIINKINYNLNKIDEAALKLSKNK